MGRAIDEIAEPFASVLDYVCPAPEPLGENQIMLVESMLPII
jgi:hypothetical protein